MVAGIILHCLMEGSVVFQYSSAAINVLCEWKGLWCSIGSDCLPSLTQLHWYMCMHGYNGVGDIQ